MTLIEECGSINGHLEGCVCKRCGMARKMVLAIRGV